MASDEEGRVRYWVRPNPDVALLDVLDGLKAKTRHLLSALALRIRSPVVGALGFQVTFETVSDIFSLHMTTANRLLHSALTVTLLSISATLAVTSRMPMS